MDEQLTHEYLLQRKLKAQREIEEQYYNDLEKLQKECEHTEVTGWLAGYQVDSRICKQCKKVIEQRYKYPTGCVGCCGEETWST